MTVLERVVALLAVIFLAAGVATALIPSNQAGVHCGTWIDPNWPDDSTAKLVHDATQTAQQANAVGQTDLADQSQALANGAQIANAACAGPLSTRRTVSIALILGALLIVPAVAFVAGGARRRRK